jgi:DNA repair exonuclease SbcCD ATPase subunit
MILRRIRVADWRCFLNPIDLGAFDEGLNIVHAPNGSGKSTLFEAFHRALLDGHKVTGRDVEMLRPWGRTLSPKVTVEFAHGGVEYRISKQFLDEPSALLERMEDGRYRRLAEGMAADDQTRALFTQNPPGRGLSRQENWGLAQILWASQGNLVLARLSGDLVTDIRSMLSVQIGGGAGPLEGKIEARYLEFFSPKGKLKAGKDAPLLTRLQEQLEEASEVYRKAQDSYLAYEESVRRVEDFRARRAQARHDAEEITKAMRRAEERAGAYRFLSAEKKQRVEQLKAAEAQYNEIKQRIDIITTTETKLSEARKTVSILEEEVPLRAREKQEREKDIARKKASLEDARKGRRSVEQADQLAEAARKFTESMKKLSDLHVLIAKVQEIETTLASRKKERTALIAPDTKTLRTIRKLIKDRDDAQAKIEASLISLEVVPESDGLLDVVAGEHIGPRTLGAGTPTLVQGSPEVVVEIAGIARLRAWGPTGSIEEHRESKAKAERKLAELTAPYGTSNPEALEALSDKAKALDEGVAESETKLATLLSDRALDGIMQDQGVQEAVLSRILEQNPEWEQSPPDAPALKAQAQEVKESFISMVESAESAWEVAQSALVAAAGQEEAATSRLIESRKLCASLESQYAEFTKDGKQPHERQREMQQLAMEWEASKGRLKEIEDRLTEFQDDPIAALESLETQRKAVEDVATTAREQEIREESKLEGLAAQGPYSALAIAEERLAQLKQDVKAEQLRVDAVRLLRDTVATCRAEAVAAVTGPVELAATRTFQRIASPRLGRIQISESFEPSAILPETAGESVPLDNLSGGEQEQLYLATRLALAHALRKDERQLVVLDDVLTASDAGRLARVMNVLEEAAQDLQILILTCHPERYRALKTGHFFDLEEALNRTEG